MKRAWILIVFVFFLAGCRKTVPGVSVGLLPAEAPQAADLLGVKRPRLPQKQPDLLEAIDRTIAPPVITEEDIRRGWYYAPQEAKKYGTPDTWYWVREGDRSRWMSPNAAVKQENTLTEELCRTTGGVYRFSCIESDAEDCVLQPESACRCTEGSAWTPEAGCLLKNTEGGFIEISAEELQAGRYAGIISEKKRGTPADWVWVEAGKASSWQRPAKSRYLTY